MICVTGQLLRCLWAPWKDHAHWGQGWPRLGGCSLLSGGSRASHMTEDWEGSAGRERRKEGHRPRVALDHSTMVWLLYGSTTVWLLYGCTTVWLPLLYGWLAGWLPPSFSKPGVRVGSGSAREEAPSAARRAGSTAPVPPQERMSAMSQLQPSDSSAAGPGVDQIR
jgi:hypothetical protein